MFKALKALKARKSKIPQDPAQLRALPKSEADSFVPGVVRYYLATKNEGAIDVLALLIAPRLFGFLALDPDISPSFFWEWLREAAAQNLQRAPWLRVESRLIDRIQQRDSERLTKKGLTQELAGELLQSQEPTPRDPWVQKSLSLAWEQLTAKEQQTVSLVWIEDYTDEEAGAVLGITARGVRYRVAKIRTKMSKAYRFFQNNPKK